MPGNLVTGFRCQVSGVRCQVSGVRCQVSGYGEHKLQILDTRNLKPET